MTYLFLIVFISNILILSKLKQIANYLNIFDKPDNRLKKHKSSVPLLGGIIMVTNFLIINTQNSNHNTLGNYHPE